MLQYFRNPKEVGKVRIKKTVWVFSMIVMLFILALIINSRIQLTSEVIVGGSDSVFVRTDNLDDPLSGYKESETSNSNKYADLEFPEINITDWRYILINAENPMNSYAPDVKSVGDWDISLDSRVVESLNELMQAARDAGFEPYLSLGYRSFSSQQHMFNEKASELSASGTYNYEEAREIAAELVAKPGTSDHQTGLSVDITDKQYDFYDYSKMNHKFFEWLDAHCSEYGFIKRYPSDKKSITGWDEPWHYRYVGKEAAAFISENGLCLEEFVAHYS